VRQRIICGGVVTTDHIALAFYAHGVTEDKLQEIILQHPRGSLEIMCHPAEVDPLLLATSSYNAWREKELAILTSPAMRSFIKDHGVQLIGFNDLRKGEGTW